MRMTDIMKRAWRKQAQRANVLAFLKALETGGAMEDPLCRIVAHVLKIDQQTALTCSARWMPEFFQAPDDIDFYVRALRAITAGREIPIR
jgi:hypothetical protein